MEELDHPRIELHHLPVCIPHRNMEKVQWESGNPGLGTMDIIEAKEFEGQTVLMNWTDRNGDAVSDEVFVIEVNFVPFYGPCFITSAGDIRLDRVIDCQAVQRRSA